MLLKDTCQDYLLQWKIKKLLRKQVRLPTNKKFELQVLVELEILSFEGGGLLPYQIPGGVARNAVETVIFHKIFTPES